MSGRTLIHAFPDGRIYSYVSLKDLYFVETMPNFEAKNGASIPPAERDNLAHLISINDESLRPPLAERYNF